MGVDLPLGFAMLDTFIMNVKKIISSKNNFIRAGETFDAWISGVCG